MISVKLIDKLKPEQIDQLSRLPVDYSDEVDIHVYLMNKIEKGEAHAYDISDSTGQCILVISVENFELNILGAIGKSEKFNLTDVIFEISKTIAKQLGLKTITFNTVRNGLIHEALKRNFKVAEVIMRHRL